MFLYNFTAKLELSMVMAQKIGLEEVVGFLEGSLDSEGMKRVESDLAKPSGSEARVILEKIGQATKNMQSRRTKEHIHQSLGIPADEPMGVSSETSTSLPPPDPTSSSPSNLPTSRSWVSRNANEENRGRDL
jgi:hypothetical protein